MVIKNDSFRYHCFDIQGAGSLQAPGVFIDSPCRKLKRVYTEFYAHTNRFCVVQVNIKPEVLKVQTELARSVH